MAFTVDHHTVLDSSDLPREYISPHTHTQKVTTGGNKFEIHFFVALCHGSYIYQNIMSCVYKIFISQLFLNKAMESQIKYMSAKRKIQVYKEINLSESVAPKKPTI